MEQWIPAFAGMTGFGENRFSHTAPVMEQWIPAFAGMTGVEK
jgi:hypothetical protein